MNNETLLSLVAFSVFISITLGQNNIMLLASGINFGFKRTIPHLVGISKGFLVLLITVNFNLVLFILSSLVSNFLAPTARASNSIRILA